ncbi:MAG TPA: acyltransferase family protein [Nocardioidaceae bacterium]|nr:acyltransferase family protein [Nocardioidaceae bacterium]
MPTTLTTARPSTESPVRSTPGRDPWFDNAKMLLVTLVVIGHSWVLLPEDTLSRNWFYDFLYLWHMPAFLVVTGYLSRSFTWTRRNLSRLVTMVAVPYFVFEALMSSFRIRVGGEDGIDTLFLEPHWPMWFLAALFFWRLATPLLKTLPAPLAVAVVVSLLGGLLTGDVLDLGRVTGMLPFFVLGLVARPEHVDRLRARGARRLGAGLLALAFAVAPFVDGFMRTEWLYWRSGYDAMDVSFVEGALVRLALIVVATALSLSALSLVPRGATWFTALGGATMTVYLFHGFFIRGAEYTGVFEWTSAAPWAGLVATTAASVVLAVALAAPPVSRRLDVVIDPVGAYRRAKDTWPEPSTGPELPDAAGTVERDRGPFSHLPR